MNRWLLLTPEFPPDMGGVARYLGVLAEGNPGIAVTRVPGVSAWASSCLRINSLIRANDAKGLIVSHVLPFGYVALASRKPYAVVCHGLDVAGPLAHPWKRFWAGVVLRRAARVIVNSEATRAVVLRYGVRPDRVRVVHPPLSWDPGTVRSEPETDFASRHGLAGKRVLLIAGRLVARKGITVAIAAFDAIAERFPGTFLLIAGDGPRHAAIADAQRRSSHADRVMLTGKIPDLELRDAYRAASVVLYPSVELPGDLEGFGIGAADAGAFGKPVVASRAGGLPEAVGDGGVLIPPGDVKALSEAVLSLLERPGVAGEIGERGRKQAARRTHVSFRTAFMATLA